MMARRLKVGVSNNLVIPSEARNLSVVLIPTGKAKRDSSLRAE
jgi:hypothetical protein